MNTAIFIMALLYAFGETAYFGWNWGPQSSAEVIADGIALLLVALAYVVGK